MSFLETRISNDSFFCHTGISVADRILVVDDVLLKHRVNNNPDSITGSRQRYMHEAVIILRQLYNWLKDKSLLGIHGDDFMICTDDVLYLNEAYPATPCFISEVTQMLNAEGPWYNMTLGEILEFLERSIFAEEDIEKEAEISSCISLELLESDAELRYLFDQFRNRVHTSRLLRHLSLERYGREFDRAESLPEL